ncbi:helix-turn-helix domain-containing protein [Aerococcaceae bacterium NML210727]|nr:helix-turn-helix domain-containing protein [Aerococcaceae bacterium NML210727]MCW6655309.1 helix-turn-helix domain-containing protein [Aerococcaceae bacterium NML201296]MCW6665330.1 helix-turn-helix domain-containing protein [Aerococcaceae bacterium NML191219]MCW6667604.1 helix-turn-helix domain-containing protein [Aerococcaceae bacterium NML190938]MCW6682936.1 helix-turn-helix domain-containing protein [Aerococcaceae bacterium NML160702]
MTLGEKIKVLRKKASLSQEEFAEKLNVSRSAVAKWESNNGVPEIINLRMISKFFSVSLDSLLDDKESIETIRIDNHGVNALLTYLNDYHDIELKGWNDGVFEVLIFGEDEEFYYYQSNDDNKRIYGLIGKKYIKAIVPSKKSKLPEYREPLINRNYFCGKPVLIERARMEGMLRGFFDFRNDDYQNVRIKSFDSSKVQLEFGGAIPISDICKIEELSS